MKKYMFSLIVSTLVSVFGAQTVSFASDNSIMGDELFSKEKVKCQSVFPALSEKLETWIKHHQAMSLMKEHFEEGRYKEVAVCLESAKAADNLYPEVRALSMTLFDSLSLLQSTYPNIESKQFLTLLEIKDQYNGIINNLSLFITKSKNKSS